MSFPRYPAYKPSGVEWLGEVPEHWVIDRMKWAIEQPRNGIWGNEECGDDNDIACVRVADFDRQKLRVLLNEPTIRNVTPKEREGRVLLNNDLLLEKSGGGELQPVGWVVIYADNKPAICSNFVAKASAKPGMSPTYWCYLHSAAYSARINTRSIKQTSGIQNLDQSQYLDELACYPPHIEQEAIATFLDRETAKIDALIAEQQRLIELLQEKRQAVISHAVTKGLNPDAPMKDSGVEWMGAVPEHWEVAKLKHLAEEKVAGPYGASLTKNMYSESGFRVYGQQQVIPNNFKIGDYYISPQIYEEMKRYRVFPGDVLISVMGTIGKAAVVPEDAEPGIINPRLVRYRLASRINPRYAQQALMSRSCQEKILLEAKGATMDGLNMQILGALNVPVPPLCEQEEILYSVRQFNDQHEALISNSSLSIRLLQERRSALISSAVTGQIDIRGLVTEAAA